MNDNICFPTAIGCDVHQKTLVCHCKQYSGENIVDSKAIFSTNYNDLPNFVNWCASFNPNAILLESTGVYWLSPFEALEQANLPVSIVNPAHVKRMIGRKTDTADAEWLAKVGTMGTFTPSFIPSKEFRDLRMVSRNITKLTDIKQSFKNRENKLFVVAGYRLHVFSDQFGKAATLAKDLILAGKTPEEIVTAIRKLKTKRLKATNEELLNAFHGKLTPSIRMIIDDCRAIIQFLDAQIQSQTEFLINEVKRLDETSFRLVLTIPGISELTAATILVEYGGGENFIAHFSNAKRAASWSGMCPGNNESGGKRFSGKSRKGNKALRRAYCESAQAAIKTKNTTLRSTYDSLVGRLGFKRAVFAIGNKICQLVYCVLSHHSPYNDPQIDYQAIACKRNAPRWLKAIKEYKDWEVTIRNKETGDVFTTADQTGQHIYTGIAKFKNRNNNSQQ